MPITDNLIFSGTATPTQSQSIMTTTPTQFFTTTTARGTTTLYQTSSYSRGRTGGQLSKETTMSQPSYASSKITRHTRKSTDRSTTLTPVDMSHRTDRQEPLIDLLTTLTVLANTDATETNINNATERKVSETSATLTTPTKTWKTPQIISTVSNQLTSKETNMSTSEASVKVSDGSSFPTEESTAHIPTSSSGVRYSISLFCVIFAVYVAY